MAKLFDDFGEFCFNNEAEVSLNFIQPLLKDFLGYDQNEILPEAIYLHISIKLVSLFQAKEGVSLNA